MEGQKQVSYTPINKNEKYDSLMEEFKQLKFICCSFLMIERFFSYDGKINECMWENDFISKIIWDLSNIYTENYSLSFIYRRKYKQDYFKKFQNKNLQKINKDKLIKFLERYGIKIKYSNWIKKNELIKIIKNIDCEKLFEKNEYKNRGSITLHYSDIVV